MQTTKLSAVNTILSTVGEAPVNSLEDLGVLDAVTAVGVLEEAYREVLSEGWQFNTDPEFLLQPQGFAPYEIAVPPTALEVTPEDTPGVIVRGSRLFDRNRTSFSFPGRAVRCHIVWYVPFEEAPEVARRYVTLRAARLFADRVLSHEGAHAVTKEEEMRARMLMRKYERRQRRPSLLGESWSVARIIHR